MNKLNTEEEYNKALQRFEEIFQAEDSTPEGKEANELSIIIKEYEDKHHSINKLTIQEYQKLAKRTCPSLGSVEKDFLHMKLGIITEVAEVLDIFKKELAYKKPIDIVNLGEELGDIAWYAVNKATFLGSVVTYNEFRLEYKIGSENNVIETLESILYYVNHINNIVKPNNILFDCKCIAEFYNLDFEEILYKNIEKLKVRYPDKFTEEAALNRNLDSERKILES